MFTGWQGRTITIPVAGTVTLQFTQNTDAVVFLSNGYTLSFRVSTGLTPTNTTTDTLSGRAIPVSGFYDVVITGPVGEIAVALHCRG